MVKITDPELLAYAERIQGKVLIITGAYRLHTLSDYPLQLTELRYPGGASGIGRQIALLYGHYKYNPESLTHVSICVLMYYHYRARVVIGDINKDAAERVANEIIACGG